MPHAVQFNWQQKLSPGHHTDTLLPWYLCTQKAFHLQGAMQKPPPLLTGGRHDICVVLMCTSPVWQRGRDAIQVLASSLSLTSSGGLTISSAQLPATLPADVNHGITHAVPALRRIFRNGGARSVASANVQQAAAVSPPVQPALSRRVASAAQHVMQPAIGAARLLVQAADAGWHQLLQGLTARRGAFATALAIALGGAALLLLALKLWRRLRKVGLGQSHHARCCHLMSRQSPAVADC